jgi:hypothetical protein
LGAARAELERAQEFMAYQRSLRPASFAIAAEKAAVAKANAQKAAAAGAVGTASAEVALSLALAAEKAAAEAAAAARAEEAVDPDFWSSQRWPVGTRGSVHPPSKRLEDFDQVSY